MGRLHQINDRYLHPGNRIEEQNSAYSSACGFISIIGNNRLQWCVAENVDRDLVHELAEKIHVPSIVARILIHREIKTYEEARAFFAPAWADLNDPYLMADMEKAVDRIISALNEQETIFIYGDYDVDGITSVSLLYLFLKERGANVHFYIPNRMEEGYGLSVSGINQAAALGTQLMITVDCGITAVEEVDLANSKGIDVIISDHHEPGDKLPAALAMLDPKREGCPYPFKQLAGVGVAFKLIQAVSQKLDLDSESYRKYIDLVALGSAADIVPLVDENRVLVSKGLEKINALDSIGIKALIDSSGLTGKSIGTGQVVFILAPRINAVGRLGSAERAVHLLITDSVEQADEIAQILEQENQHRKAIDEETFQEALMQLESVYDEPNDSAVVLCKEGWHSGVIGIVASRIVEQIYRPTVMIEIEDGIGKGSARSIPDFDIYSALKKCESYLLGFGGHKYAAGLTIDPEQIAPFTEAFKKVTKEIMKEEHLVQKIHIDAEILLSDITDKFVRLLNRFAPFGPKNMRPVFLTKNIQAVGIPKIVGRNHLKFRVRQGEALFDVIGFNLGGKLKLISEGESNLDMVYVVEENNWNGKIKTQLRIKDLR